MWATPTLFVNTDAGSARTPGAGLRHNWGMSGRPRTPSSDKPRTPLAQRVQDLRLALPMTQVDLAAAVGVSRAHIGKVETGDDSIGAATLHALAVIFGVSMDYLWTGKHPSPPPPSRGRLVDEIEQLAILDLWQSIPRSERARVMRMIAAASDPEPSVDLPPAG